MASDLNQQVVVGYVDVAQVGADRPGEDYLVEPELHFLERHRQLGLVGFGKREQEFLVLVLGDQLDERRERSVGEKYLPLAVYDVFLQVQRDGLRVAEIFHSLGNRDARLLADPEKVVDRRPARENDRAVLQYLYPLTSELFRDKYLTIVETSNGLLIYTEDKNRLLGILNSLII